MSLELTQHILYNPKVYYTFRYIKIISLFQIESLIRQGDRLQIEYSTLVGETKLDDNDIEVILLPLGGKPTEARFLIRISIDCCLPPCVDKSQDNETMLHITFYGPDWNRIVSKLYLSKTLEKIFGGPDTLHLPPLPPSKYLMDYVPEVKKYIEEKVRCDIIHTCMLCMSSCVLFKFQSYIDILRYTNISKYDER